MTPNSLTFGKTLGLGLVCSAVVLMTACGGSSSSRSATATPTPTSSPAPSATPAPTATPDPTPAPTDTSGKVSGPMDTVQDDVVTAIIVDTVAPELPAPFDSVAVCLANAINSLVDVPDAALLLAQAGPTADPAVTAAQVQTSLENFAGQIQNLAYALNGDGNCDDSHPENPFADDQFAGTPLQPVIDALEVLAGELTTQGASESPDLTALTSAVQPALQQLSAAFAGLPADAYAAPVVGPTLTALADALSDVESMLDEIGSFDAAGTQAGIENLVTNLVNNVLLGVVPVSGIDGANDEVAPLGADPSAIEAQVQTLIATLNTRFGSDLETVIPSNFGTALMNAANPSSNAFTSILGGSSPLDGVLSGIAGNGSADPLDLLTSMFLAQSSGLPTDALIAGLTGDTSTLSPLELMEALGSADSTDVTLLLTNVINTSDLLGLSVQDSVLDVIDTALGGLLDDLLGGLLGGLF